MKKDVLVSISGLQYDIDQEEAVEIISVGEYYNRNGKHYITYEEILEEVEGVSACTIKISEKQIDIIKRGPNNVHMIFEENFKNTTFYQTPFGDIEVGIFTTKIHQMVQEDQFLFDIEYDLDINCSFVSKCHIQIKVKERKQQI